MCVFVQCAGGETLLKPTGINIIDLLPNSVVYIKIYYIILWLWGVVTTVIAKIRSVISGRSEMWNTHAITTAMVVVGLFNFSYRCLYELF